MMPPVSCSASQHQDPELTAQQSNSEAPALHTSPAFQGVQGRPTPNPFQGWLFRERHHVTQSFDLGVCFRVLPRNRATRIYACACVRVCVCINVCTYMYICVCVFYIYVHRKRLILRNCLMQNLQGRLAGGDTEKSCSLNPKAVCWHSCFFAWGRSINFFVCFLKNI